MMEQRLISNGCVWIVGPMMIMASVLICWGYADQAGAATLHSLTAHASVQIDGDLDCVGCVSVDLPDMADSSETSIIAKTGGTDADLRSWLKKGLPNPYLTVADERFTLFQLAQTLFEPETPPQAVGTEPVVLPVHEPVQPRSSFPSSALIFVLVSVGMIGVAVRGESFVNRSQPARAPQFGSASSVRSIGVVSTDVAFARDLESQLRYADYGVQVARSASEIVAITDPASLALILVDYRIQDWDMLRTDPMIQQVLLMGVVPRGHLYTEDRCLSDLERGMDGVHDFRDSSSLFLARVRAFLHRTDPHAVRRGVYQVGTIQLDVDTHDVRISGRQVKLSAKPFAILTALMRQPLKVFSRRELISLVWGPDFAVGGHVLDVHVHSLRQQLNREPNHSCRLLTIKGVGFKLKLIPSPRPLLGTGVDSSMRSMAVDGDDLYSTAGRRNSARVPVTKPAFGTAEDWCKPSMRRRARSLRKAVASSHRRAAALVR